MSTNAPEAPRRTAPFVFPILGPDLLGSDAAVDVLGGWHHGSPARLKPGRSAADRGPAILERAERAERAGGTDVVDPADRERPERVAPDRPAVPVSSAVSATPTRPS